MEPRTPGIGKLRATRLVKGTGMCRAKVRAEPWTEHGLAFNTQVRREELQESRGRTSSPPNQGRISQEGFLEEVVLCSDPYHL